MNQTITFFLFFLGKNQLTCIFVGHYVSKQTNEEINTTKISTIESVRECVGKKMSSSLETTLLCPISLQLFEDPVLAEDGHTYERVAITEWIRRNGTSPLTRQPLRIDALRPNIIIKKVVDDFESNVQSKKYEFKMNIDVRRDKRALFQTFGKRIYKAEWITQEQRPPVIILQIDGARAQKEASFYVKLSRHPHIIRTYGLVEDVIPSTTSVMLLQEYAPEGSLFEFLTDQQELPNDKILEEMFIQIADAMVFLAHNQIVHGDLACRNVLIFRYDPNDAKRNMVKLTDFGLSRFSSIYSSVLAAISTTTIHIVPTRTAAPEILENSSAAAYTEKSDMYSMGMLMIEVYNKGTMHWADIPNENDVRAQVIAGNRPARPARCTVNLWTIISVCLSQRAAERPSFRELRDRLTGSMDNSSSENLPISSSPSAPTSTAQASRPTSATQQHRLPSARRNSSSTVISNTTTDLPPINLISTPRVLPPILRKSNPPSSTPAADSKTPLQPLTVAKANCTFCDHDCLLTELDQHENNCIRNPRSYNSRITVETSAPPQPPPSIPTEVHSTVLPQDAFASLMSLSASGGTGDHQQDLFAALMPLITQAGGRNVVIRSTPSTVITTQTQEQPKPQMQQISNVSTVPTTTVADGRTSQVRPISNFQSIKTSGIFNIILTMDTTKPESLTLVSDQPKLLEKIETSVSMGVLRVEVAGNSSSSSSTRHQHTSTSTHTRSTSNQRGKGKTDVLINAHRLNSLKTSGMESVEISGSGIKADIFELKCSGFNSIYGTINVKQLEATIDGFCKVHLMGTANNIALTVDGSSKFHGFDLSTKIANITIHGNCYAEMNCAQTMTVDISDDDDGGTVKFKGDATVIRSAGSTGGTIEKIC